MGTNCIVYRIKNAVDHWSGLVRHAADSRTRCGRYRRTKWCYLKIGLGLFFITMTFYTMPAQACEHPVIPDQSDTYTKKVTNYNPEYEYLLNQLYSTLPSRGSESMWIDIEGFYGTEEEIRDFADYIFSKYDYTMRLKLSYKKSADNDSSLIMSVYFDNPKQIYEMQMTAEGKMVDFSKTLRGLSDQDKVIKINNWLVDNAEYDYSLGKVSCYSNIVEGASTCNGFASAFYAVCSYSGVECEDIVGYAGDKLHRWNVVDLGSEEKYVDVTWNAASNSDHWLLISQEEMSRDHIRKDMS